MIGNFLIHYKSNEDRHSLKSLGWTLDNVSELLGNAHDFEKAASLLPEQKWVVKLISKDRKELIASFMNMGEWLENSFYITDEN